VKSVFSFPFDRNKQSASRTYDVISGDAPYTDSAWRAPFMSTEITLDNLMKSEYILVEIAQQRVTNHIIVNV
jgi:hypothetical protein